MKMIIMMMMTIFLLTKFRLGIQNRNRTAVTEKNVVQMWPQHHRNDKHLDLKNFLTIEKKINLNFKFQIQTKQNKQIFDEIRHRMTFVVVVMVFFTVIPILLVISRQSRKERNQMSWMLKKTQNLKSIVDSGVLDKTNVIIICTESIQKKKKLNSQIHNLFLIGWPPDYIGQNKDLLIITMKIFFRSFLNLLSFILFGFLTQMTLFDNFNKINFDIFDF